MKFNFFHHPHKRKKTSCSFLTGAGISAESGISMFRDTNGLWEQYKIEDIASIEGWNRHPDVVNQFYNQRHQQLISVFHCKAHMLLVQLKI